MASRLSRLLERASRRSSLAELRQQKVRPILESIKSQIQVARSQTLPKSALAKACNYTLTLWNRLTRFLDHPILELSTNAAENAIRPVALGRKN
jgi:transposase